MENSFFLLLEPPFAYLLAISISLLSSSQVSLLSFGPITFTTVGVAQAVSIINNKDVIIVFCIFKKGAFC